jgi:hypothetical protein
MAYDPLLAQLREIAPTLPASHVPAPAEEAGILAALVYYVEHGPALTAAARSGDLTKVEEILTPERPADYVTPAPPIVPGDQSATIKSLQDQLAAAKAGEAAEDLAPTSPPTPASAAAPVDPVAAATVAQQAAAATGVANVAASPPATVTPTPAAGRPGQPGGPAVTPGTLA